MKIPSSGTKLLFAFCLIIVFTCFKQDKDKISIFSIGDSTMAEYNIEKLSAQYEGENYPLRGWMMMMMPFFSDRVKIINAGVSGRSSKNFRTEGHWQKVIEKIKPGDYLFIQFGHNDSKTDTIRYTDPRTSFRQNLINYINEAKAKGALPVLFTSIPRRSFDKEGKLLDTHGDYVTVVRDLAKEMHLPLVDLNKKMAKLIQELGPEESKKLFLWLEPGQFKKIPEGKQDDTHLNVYGANRVAELAAQGLKELNLPVARYLR